MTEKQQLAPNFSDQISEAVEMVIKKIVEFRPTLTLGELHTALIKHSAGTHMSILDWATHCLELTSCFEWLPWEAESQAPYVYRPVPTSERIQRKRNRPINPPTVFYSDNLDSFEGTGLFRLVDGAVVPGEVIQNSSGNRVLRVDTVEMALSRVAGIADKKRQEHELSSRLVKVQDQLRTKLEAQQA